MNREYDRAATEPTTVSTFIATCLLVLVIVATVQVTRSCVEYSRIDNNCQQHLHEDDWQRMLKGKWMIQFHSPLCTACKKFEPTWRCLSKVAKDLNINVAKIDVSTAPSLRGRFDIRALPTIFHVRDGEFYPYTGSIDRHSLMLWLERKQWKEIEPISNWRKPNTIQMSIISYFFKLSYALKDINARLQGEYGLSVWGCYAIFAITTTIIVTVLGLILGKIVDLIHLPKKSHKQTDGTGKEMLNAVFRDAVNDDENEDVEIQYKNYVKKENDLGKLATGKRNYNHASRREREKYLKNKKGNIYEKNF